MSDAPTILVISAHAADFCSRSGGTLAKYVKAGSEAQVIDLTYGERGESYGLWRKNMDMDVEEVKRIRRGEAERAAAILGVKIDFLDWGDHPLVIDHERKLALVDLIRKIGPQFVLTHWAPDLSYPDHHVTGEAVAQACQLVGALGLKLTYPPIPSPQVLYFEATYPNSELTAFSPNTYIDITDVFDQKIEALRELAATQVPILEYYTSSAIRRGQQAREYSGKREIVYAEAYVRLFPWAGQFFP